MSEATKRLRHDGGIIGTERKRWGVWRKLFFTQCLAHDGGVIGMTIGIRRLVNRCNRLVDVRISRISRQQVNLRKTDDGIRAGDFVVWAAR
jgi:hypothetical protein